VEGCIVVAGVVRPVSSPLYLTNPIPCVVFAWFRLPLFLELVQHVLSNTYGVTYRGWVGCELARMEYRSHETGGQGGVWSTWRLGLSCLAASRNGVVLWLTCSRHEMIFLSCSP
jgi:hypothetical protein